MKNLNFSLVRLFIFWVVLFYLQHLSFLINILINGGSFTLYDAAESFVFAFYMNISAASYLLVIPSLLLFAAALTKKNKYLLKATDFIIILQIIICIIAGTIDNGLFSAWGTKINAKAVSYIMYPSEMMKGITSVNMFPQVLSFLTISILSLWVYIKWIRVRVIPKTNGYYLLLVSLVLFPLLFIGLRGGIQPRPINKGWIYHSTKPSMNNASLNSFWNLASVLVNMQDNSNPYIFYTDEFAAELVKEMHETKVDTTEQIISVSNPNIVLILMESISAGNLETLGGKPGIMPGLDSLTRHSITFTDFYANGFRTEQGIIAFLSGFPAQPAGTVIRHFGKFEALPNLGNVLSLNNYTNNYYYSGDLSYANTKSYLLNGDFSKITGEEQNWSKKTKWGAYDEELFGFHLANANKDREPFFSILMTSTNHEPFDGEVEIVFTENNIESDYKNTSYYTDKCIIEYLKKASLEPWYSNTLFIITSDHAHSLPGHWAHNSPERHHIPLLLFGNVLKKEYHGLRINKTASQVDLPATILAQLNINHSVFKWSKNMLNPYSPSFAFYTFDNGFGLITGEEIAIYDHNMRAIISDNNRQSKTEGTSDLPKKGKAYLQFLISEFLSLSF